MALRDAIVCGLIGDGVVVVDDRTSWCWFGEKVVRLWPEAEIGREKCRGTKEVEDEQLMWNKIN